MADGNVDKAKFDNAVDKMVDYQTDVAKFASKGDLASADADALTAGADVVIACIQQIGL